MNSPPNQLDDSTFAESTLQPPPADDGTLASEPMDSPVHLDDVSNFEDEESPPDLQAAGASLPDPEELKVDRGALQPPPADAVHLDDVSNFEDEESPPDLQAAGASLPDPEELKVDRSAYEGCCKMWVWITLVFVCLISLTVGLIVGISKKEGGDSASLSRGNDFVPVTRERVRAAMRTYIVDSGVSSSNDFSSSSSPQSKALDFLANEDPLQLNAPLSGLSSDEGYEFISRYVMTVFHASMGGDTWNYDLLFKTKHETCEWYDVFQPPVGQVGVLCNQNTKKIVGLSFISNQLQGTLPTELAVLSTLTYFESIGNDIRGTIPDRLQDLTNLETAVFAYNNLSGSIPGWINKWSNLQFLYASNNQLTGSLPNSLAQLSKLSVLALDDNVMTGPISSVWQLRNMEYLYLEDNSFSGILPASILSSTPELVNLDISTNKLAGDLPSDLLKLSRLEIIDLHGNNFGGVLPSDVTPTSNDILSFLALHDNMIAGSIPTQFGLLGRLQHLDLTNNRLTGIFPAELTNLNLLTYLFVGENLFTPGPIPTYVYTYNNLRELSLKSAKRTGQMSDLVQNLSNLILLDLDNNDLTGPIPSEIGTMNNLQFLLLNRNKLSGPVPSQLGNLNSIRFLLLDSNDLTGSIDASCAKSSLGLAIADCQEVSCGCCNPCCLDGQECHDNLEVANIDPIWERGYDRDFFDFSNSSGFFTGGRR